MQYPRPSAKTTKHDYKKQNCDNQWFTNKAFFARRPAIIVGFPRFLGVSFFAQITAGSAQGRVVQIVDSIGLRVGKRSGRSGTMCIRHGRRYFWFSSCAIVMRSRWGNSSSTVRRLMSQPMHDEELHRKLYDRADHVWVVIFLAAVRIYTPITGHMTTLTTTDTTTTTVTTSTTASTAAATWRNHLEEAGRVV